MLRAALVVLALSLAGHAVAQTPDKPKPTEKSKAAPEKAKPAAKAKAPVRPAWAELTADLDGWRRKLLEAPWVADAAIRRVFPGTLAVAISERQPLGIGRQAPREQLLEAQRSVLSAHSSGKMRLSRVERR